MGHARVKTELETVIPFFIEWGRTVTHPATDSPKGCRLQAVSFGLRNQRACATRSPASCVQYRTNDLRLVSTR